jgi:putative transport protein
VGIATWFAATLRQYPEIAIFLALALGYYFGKFTFRGIGLGSVTATLLAGVMIGQLGMFIRSISLFVWLRTTELSC